MILCRREGGFIDLFTCELRNRPPTKDTVVEDEVHELVIFLNGPWTSLQPYLVTTRLPPHSRGF